MTEENGVKADISNLKDAVHELKCALRDQKQEYKADCAACRLEIKDELKALNEKYSGIIEYVSESKGSHTFLIGAVTIAASLGAALTYFVKLFHG